MTPDRAAAIVAGDAAELRTWRAEDRAVDLAWARAEDDAWEDAQMTLLALGARRMEISLERIATDVVEEGVTDEG